MTVKELIALLQSCSQDSIVICQADGEGNGYSPLSGIDEDCTYHAESTWSGEVHGTEDDDEDQDEEFDEDQPTGVPCVVLFPVN